MKGKLIAAAKSTGYLLVIFLGIGSLLGTLFFQGLAGAISLYILSIYAGFLLIPGLIYLFGKSIGMTPFARVMYTIAAITTDGLAIDQREYGHYEAQPLRKNNDGVWQHRRDGEWVDVEDGLENISRLGKRPFTITHEKSEAAYKKWLADVKAEDARALTDGGAGDYYELDTSRAGGLVQLSPKRVVEGAAEGFVIRMDAVRNSLLGAGGSSIADKTEEETLKEMDFNMGTKVMVAYAIIMAILGMGGGILVWG